MGGVVDDGKIVDSSWMVVVLACLSLPVGVNRIRMQRSLSAQPSLVRNLVGALRSRVTGIPGRPPLGTLWLIDWLSR